MIAKRVDDVLVQEMVEYAGVSFLYVSLRGDDHYSMYKNYASLPDVVMVDDMKYGKSCWDSDKGMAYYRSDKVFATVCQEIYDGGVHRGRRVSDEEAQDRYDEAMRYLDNQKN